MRTKHEAVAAAVHAATEAAFAAPGQPRVTREVDLPETCPPEGLVNLRFEDPVELGRAFGGQREWSRVCAIEIVVQITDPASRLARFEEIVLALSPLHGAKNVAGHVDLIDLGPPTEVEIMPMEGASTIRAGIVETTLYYTTGDNPMEAIE